MCIAPCALAVFAASALARSAEFSASGLWFIYEGSYVLGCLGVGIAAVAAVAEGVRRQIPAIFPRLMGAAAVFGILLLWYARHIYGNPWASRT